jgi:FMN reductase
VSVVLLAGSPSPASRSTAVLRRLCQLAGARQSEFELIELRELPPDALLYGTSSDALAKAQARVQAARGIALATPVYKAAYSGLLKTFLDYLPEGALRGKAAYPLATGGSHAHLLAVDYALKPVLSVLGAARILDGLYLTNDAVIIGDDGIARLGGELDSRLESAVAELLR